MASSPITVPVMDRRQVRATLLGVWVAWSLCALLPLVLPFVLSQASLVTVSGWLVAPHDTPCILCGMTHSFIFIARGQFAQAHAANALSLPLFAALLVNSVIFVLFAIRLLWTVHHKPVV